MFSEFSLSSATVPGLTELMSMKKYSTVSKRQSNCTVTVTLIYRLTYRECVEIFESTEKKKKIIT